KTELGRDCSDDFAECFLATLDIHERACRGPSDSQYIERGNVGDMDVRPTVQPTSDVTGHTGYFSLTHQCGYLPAVRRRAQRIAIDHRIAENHCLDAGGRKHQLVDSYASGPFGERHDWRHLIKDPIGRFTHGEIRHDTAAA